MKETAKNYKDRIKNGDFKKYKNGAVAYAWFIWQKGYTGKTTVMGWI